MSKHSFILNGKRVSVEIEDNVRLLWVLRDVLGVTGPKYGCGIRVCRACTSHLNGKAFNPCAVPVGDISPTDRITTIEGLAKSVNKDLHPVQEAWIAHDVAQCGYCQPGQVMAAAALIDRHKKSGTKITGDELDQIRNICRCGSYHRIRAALQDAAAAV